MKNIIFGTGSFAKEVAKIFELNGIKIDEFVNVEDKNKVFPKEVYNDIPVYHAEHINKYNPEEINVIIAKKPMFLESAIAFLRENNVKNIYVVNEELFFDKEKTLKNVKKYLDKINIYDKPFLNYLEMNIVDNCNLNCKGCAHFSNICEANCVSVEDYEKDLKLVCEKFYLYNFRLLGGEPLLHPNLDKIIEITRKLLPTSRIILVTNGLLIPKLSQKTLEILSKNNIIITISLYESTFKNLDNILNTLKEYNIKYLINDDYFKEVDVIKTFHTYLSLEKDKEGYEANKKCGGRFCRFLRDGKISKCYYPLLIGELNKKFNTNFELTEDDFIELNSITNGWDAINKMNGDIPFCEYCRLETREFDWESARKKAELDDYVLTVKRKK